MPHSDAAPCVLFIDDESLIRHRMGELLRRNGYRVLLAEDGLMALQHLEHNSVDIALVDRNLRDELGEELIPQLLDVSPSTLCFGITGQGTAQTGKLMLEAGAEDYFTKPITDYVAFFDSLQHHLRRRWEGASEHRQVRARLLELHRQEVKLRRLKGNSPAMLEMVEEIRVLAPLPVPVLIRGESGTGKELVAQAMHDLSPGSAGPFIPINCAAIPRELFESTLFGHVKGSFTGALKDRKGLCREAAGGTLFLDEVGELPLEMQAKMLRVIEQREFRQVGSERPEVLQARVIAATHVDLEQAIELGRFRLDLYFRLSSQEIYVPPLRERSEDIHQLSFHFIERYNKAFGRHIKRIHPDALQLLKEWGWQMNNVRELDREIQRALARCGSDEDVLTPEMLFRHSQPRARPVQESAASSGFVEGLLELPYKEAIKTGRDRVARWYLGHYLRQADGNQTLAARLAHNMQRTHLTKLVKTLGIELEAGDGASEDG